MCLVYDKESTEKCTNLMDIGKARFCKYYRVSVKKELIEYYRQGVVSIGSDGIITSDRESVNLTQLEVETGEIEKGIHAYWCSMAKPLSGRAILVNVYAEKEDLVAASLYTRDCAFTKIKIDLAELQQKLDTVNMQCCFCGSVSCDSNCPINNPYAKA